MSLDGAAGLGSIARMTGSAPGGRGMKLSVTPQLSRAHENWRE
jgi:hypothetical protein